MIRLRIGKEFKTYSKEGLLWYKEGRTYRVIIEQEVFNPKFREDSDLGTVIEELYEPEWVPVEVIECPTE